MAKMKRMRQKLHIAAAKSKEKNANAAKDKDSSGDQPMTDIQFKPVGVCSDVPGG